jgi:tetratricopeptide (TPR) repeat protein
LNSGARIENIPNASYQGNNIYFGINPSTPQIGDVRITYRVVEPTDVSIVSRQVGGSFEPYHARAGGTIDMLELDLVSADNMFQQAQQSNTIKTWLYRAGGFIAMLIGVAMILRPLSVAADVIPFLGGIAGAGTAILSLLIAAPLTFLTVAVAWLRYRPVIGITFLILTVIIAGFVLIVSKRGKGKALKQQTSANSRTSKRLNRKDSQSEKIEYAAPGEIDDDGIDIRPKTVNQIADDGIGFGSPTVKTQAIQKNAGEMLRKGQNYFRTGQYDKAVMEFSRALKSGGDKKLALYNRGVALFKLNKKEAALKDFKYAAGMGHEKSKAIILKVRNSAV